MRRKKQVKKAYSRWREGKKKKGRDNKEGVQKVMQEKGRRKKGKVRRGDQKLQNRDRYGEL